MDPKAEIKARLPIDQLVGQYCQLQRKGRNFVCLCPFHNDTHPSFLVSPDKGIGYCFACQTGGDIFNFYMAIEGVDFPTAIKDLAEKTGVKLPKEVQTGMKKGEKERLRECLEQALRFFEEKLSASKEAMAYLHTRGVDDALRKEFHVGYAPDSFSATYDHLLKEGFKRSEILGAGLAVQKDLADEKIYDRFRHRLMFPIHDHQGYIVGFGGRAMRSEEAKYINSPEGPLYRKSSVMYGLSSAKDTIRETKKVLLVEGYFDVIAAHKAGIRNVVAVSGTALTGEHAKLLNRYADTALLCLDQDRAGKEAAVRAFCALSAQNLQVHAISIPAKDPDEFVQKDPQAFGKAINGGGKPYLTMVIDELAQGPALDSPVGKRAAAEQLIPLLDALTVAVEREAYLAKAAELFSVSEGALREDIARWKKGEQKKQTVGVMIEKTPYSRMELCLGIAMLYPQHRRLLSDLIPPESAELHALYAALTASEKDGDEIISALDSADETKERLKVLLLFCEDNFQFSDMLAKREMHKLCMSCNREVITGKQKEIVRKLKEARRAGRIDEELQLLTQYQHALKLAKMAS